MPDLVFKKPGYIELVRYSDNARNLKNGVVNSISSSITDKETTLPDGNSSWDLVFNAGKDGKITVNLSSFQPKLYAALTGGTFTTGVPTTLRRIEEQSIPDASPHTCTLTQTNNGNLVIHNEEDSPFVSVASSPATGQYSIAGTSVVTFNSADAGQEVILAYDTVSSTGNKMSIPSEPTSDVFRMIIAGEGAYRKNDGITKLDTFTFDRVKISGEIASPSREKEPKGWNFTMQVLKPRPGYNAVDYALQ